MTILTNFDLTFNLIYGIMYRQLISVPLFCIRLLAPTTLEYFGIQGQPVWGRCNTCGRRGNVSTELVASLPAGIQGSEWMLGLCFDMFDPGELGSELNIQSCSVYSIQCASLLSMAWLALDGHLRKCENQISTGSSGFPQPSMKPLKLQLREKNQQ